MLCHQTDAVDAVVAMQSSFRLNCVTRPSPSREKCSSMITLSHFVHLL